MDERALWVSEANIASAAIAVMECGEQLQAPGQEVDPVGFPESV